MLPIHQEFTSSLQYAYDMGYITNMLQNKEKQSNQSQGQNDQIQAFVDAQYKQIGASKEHKESEVARGFLMHFQIKLVTPLLACKKQDMSISFLVKIICIQKLYL